MLAMFKDCVYQLWWLSSAICERTMHDKPGCVHRKLGSGRGSLCLSVCEHYVKSSTRSCLGKTYGWYLTSLSRSLHWYNFSKLWHQRSPEAQKVTNLVILWYTSEALTSQPTQVPVCDHLWPIHWHWQLGFGCLEVCYCYWSNWYLLLTFVKLHVQQN